MRSILLAADGSKAAFRAAKVAAQLAKSLGMPLWIVTVTDNRRDPTPAELEGFTRVEHLSRPEVVEALAVQVLTKAREQAEGTGAREVHIESRSGDVTQTILEVAREKDAEAIVVGKRGHGTLAGLLIGGVPQKLVSLAPCTVIVVP